MCTLYLASTPNNNNKRSSNKIRNLEDTQLSVGFVVSHSFYGSPGSILRVRELSKSLTKLGVTCHIFSPFSYEAWGPNIFFHKIFSSLFGLQDTIYNLTRKMMYDPFLMRHVILKKNILENMINRFSKALLKSLSGKKIDIIQGEQEIAAIACLRLSNKVDIPTVTSLHNIWSEELVAGGIIENPSNQYSLLESMESEIIKNSKTIVVVGEAMAKYLKNRYSVKRKNLLIIPPGGRLRNLKTTIKIKPYRVVYSGLVVPRAHLDLFIKSIPFVKKKYPKTKFYITKRGDSLKQIKRLANNLGLNPVYYWYSKSEDFYQFLKSCHVGVIPSNTSIPRKIGPAVKLFDYLSVGLPVVANDIGGWSKIIKLEEVGILTEDNPKSFAKGILKVLDNENLAQNFSEKGKKLIKNKYNWDISAKKLLQKYKAIS